MSSVRPRVGVGLVVAVLAIGGIGPWATSRAFSQAPKAQPAPPPAAASALPGVPAPAQTVAELRRALADAVARLEARDMAGVLAHVSDRYLTSPLTKPALRDQLLALFGLYDTVKAQIRIDEVRIIGDQAWVWSTGEVTGRLMLVRRWMPVYAWEREPEVARREDGHWRLYGDQQ